jgi:hypothetical protein
MWLRTLIADMRNALAGDPSTGQSAFAALGALVIVNEADVRAGARCPGPDMLRVPGGLAGAREIQDYPAGPRRARRSAFSVTRAVSESK